MDRDKDATGPDNNDNRHDSDDEYVLMLKIVMETESDRKRL